MAQVAVSDGNLHRHTWLRKKYNKKVLEACCKKACDTGRMTYTFIKNAIPGIAEETMSLADTARINEEKNQGALSARFILHQP